MLYFSTNGQQGKKKKVFKKKPKKKKIEMLFIYLYKRLRSSFKSAGERRATS